MIFFPSYFSIIFNCFENKNQIFKHLFISEYNKCNLFWIIKNIQRKYNVKNLNGLCGCVAPPECVNIPVKSQNWPNYKYTSQCSSQRYIFQVNVKEVTTPDIPQVINTHLFFQSKWAKLHLSRRNSLFHVWLGKLSTSKKTIRISFEMYSSK